MNAPAVPKYVSDAAGDFTDCPPGHRFNLYFPIWREGDWQLDKQGKAAALRQSLKLGSAAKALEALSQRQKSLAKALTADQCFIMEARSTAPFATGLGLEHPIENGFAFLSPYGLPFLAGSGVKGVLRRSAEELRDNNELSQPVIDALFGHEDANNARRGALICWDVFAVPPKDGAHKDSLVVEIMTPHFGDYYQNDGTPHDAGKPNPIPFLAVPARSTFRFVIACEPALLTDAVQKSEWKTLVERIVEHAFDWLGFGAKTAAGYGAMEDPAKADTELQATSPAGEQPKHAPASGRSQNVSKETVWDHARLKFNAGNGTLTAVGPGNAEANALAPRGQELLATLPAEVQRKVRANQFVRVTAKVRGSELISVEV